MRLRYEETDEEFRAELRSWLDENQPPPEDQRGPRRSSAHIPEWARAWQRTLFDAGWLVPGWPPDRGGRDATTVQQMIYFEEMAARELPRTVNPQGLSIVTPSIVDHGTDEQQERWVLPTLRAEVSWCIGMSEPGAGSDLAGLQTRAVLDGDRFVVVAPSASRFARVVADVSHRARQDVAIADQLIGRNSITFGHEVVLAACVHVCRTVAHARRQTILTVQRVDLRVVLGWKRSQDGNLVLAEDAAQHQRTTPSVRERHLLRGISECLGTACDPGARDGKPCEQGPPLRKEARYTCRELVAHVHRHSKCPGWRRSDLQCE